MIFKEESWICDVCCHHLLHRNVS